jgi:hypothetical protein
MTYKIKPIKWFKDPYDLNHLTFDSIIGHMVVVKWTKEWFFSCELSEDIHEKTFKTKQQAIDYANKFYLERLLPALEEVK